MGLDNMWPHSYSHAADEPMSRPHQDAEGCVSGLSQILCVRSVAVLSTALRTLTSCAGCILSECVLDGVGRIFLCISIDVGS